MLLCGLIHQSEIYEAKNIVMFIYIYMLEFLNMNVQTLKTYRNHFRSPLKMLFDIQLQESENYNCNLSMIYFLFIMK